MYKIPSVQSDNQHSLTTETPFKTAVHWAKSKHASVWQDVFSHARKHLAALTVGTLLGTRKVWNFLKDIFMPRKKQPDQEALLTHNLIIRVSQNLFDKLEKLYQESDCQSIAEVARKILANEKINCFYRDISMNAPLEEMTGIRKELKAIGININQITRSFNQDKTGTHRAFYALKVADLYQKVDEKVERLLVLIAHLADQWLQK